MTIELLTFVVLIIVICLIYKHHRDVQWQKLPLHNFPFVHKGKEFWYSRSVAVTNLVFAKNDNDEWCILANKRGSGTPDFQGFWNVPCGYLDFNETGEEAAQRETYEETGVYIKKEKISLFKVNTSPSENRQNVSLNYFSVAENINDFVLNDSNSEKDEINEIKWIKISEIDNYNWAFNHNKLIKSTFDNNIKK